MGQRSIFGTLIVVFGIILTGQPAKAQSILECADVVDNINGFIKLNNEYYEQYLSNKNKAISVMNEKSSYKGLKYQIPKSDSDRNLQSFETGTKALGGWIKRARNYRCADSSALDAIERKQAANLLYLRQVERDNPLPDRID